MFFKKRLGGDNNIIPKIKKHLLNVPKKYLETAVINFLLEYFKIYGTTAFIILLIV